MKVGSITFQPVLGIELIGIWSKLGQLRSSNYRREISGQVEAGLNGEGYLLRHCWRTFVNRKRGVLLAPGPLHNGGMLVDILISLFAFFNELLV